MKLKVAVAQATPAVLDLAASVEKACQWIADAGKQGAQLVAFPETWLPCYPLWCDAGTLGKWEHAPAKKLHARLMRNSPTVPGPDIDKLCEAAKKAGVAVVMGLNERDDRTGTLYNGLAFINEQGELLGRRRKLVPTFGERMVWGYGDANGLDAFDLAGAKVGGMICWEHWMPLPRFVLHGSGEQIHIAAWPHVREKYLMASRHYAFEGRCFVLATAIHMKKSDLPQDLELMDDFKDAKSGDDLLGGGSCVIGPDGDCIVEPVYGKEVLLTAEIDLERVSEEKLSLSTAGHYHRPDLFEVRVRREPLKPFERE